MPKAHSSKKEIHRLKMRQAFQTATQVRIIVGTFKTQAELDTMLKQEPDMDKRRQFFNFVRPFVKFANPRCPTPFDVESRIIRP